MVRKSSLYMQAPIIEHWRVEAVFLGLGANLGDRAATLRDALRRVHAGPAKIRATSSLWESAPMGPQDQPPYLNLVAEVETLLPPEELHAALLAVERALGRPQASLRWGPRLLDIDILLYGRQSVRSERLTIPHPGLRERDFVLAPLAERWPSLALPPDGATAGALLSRLAERHGAAVREPAAWEVP